MNWEERDEKNLYLCCVWNLRRFMWVFIKDASKMVGLGTSLRFFFFIFFFFVFGRYVTTLTWSKAKNKVIGHLAMTHALASHALMTLNFNYQGISQFTLDFYSITSLCLGRRLLVILCSYIVLYRLLD